MTASTGKILGFRRVWLLIALVTVATTFVACSGSGDNAGSGPVIIDSGGVGDDSGSAGVIGAAATPLGLPKPTATKPVNETPTPIPPDKTGDEEGTARLVDELSSEDYPRTSARTIEREFRNEPETAQQRIGKDFVIQGDVLEAGKDASGQPFVHFKAGAGRVTCHFEAITDAELLRFSPDGTNAVVGTVDSWDAENRILTV